MSGLTRAKGQVISAKAPVYIKKGSFEGGVNLDERNQVVYHFKSNSWYLYKGNIPSLVPAASTPDDNWINVGDAEAIPSIEALRLYQGSFVGQRVEVMSHSGYTTESGDTGGGVFVCVNSSNLVDDNGKTIVGVSRWVREMRGLEYVTPMMFGAAMNAPYIDGHTIQGNSTPRAPSMGAASLIGVRDDGSALKAAYETGLPVYIEQPMYIGATSIDVSKRRFQCTSLNLKGAGQRKAIIYTSGLGGFKFIEGGWGHNYKVEDISFRNADEDYAGCPLLISSSDQQTGGGGHLYTIHNVGFYHYKFALPIAPFVSRVENIYMYDCKYGIAMTGTSTSISSVWAHHCDRGFLWGAGVNRDTLEPIKAAWPLMYVACDNLAADGCMVPHTIYRFRGFSITGLGVEGINGGDCVFDFSNFNDQEFMSTGKIDGLSIWLQASNAESVTHVVKLPNDQQNALVQDFVFNSGYINTDKAIAFYHSPVSQQSYSTAHGFRWGDAFHFLGNSQGITSHEDDVRASGKFNGVFIGEHPGEGYRNSYDGLKLSAKHMNTEAIYQKVVPLSGRAVVPCNRNLDIFIGTEGREGNYTGGVILTGRVDMIPIGITGVSTNAHGGSVLFSVTAGPNKDLSTADLWSNKLTGDKLFTGIEVSKVKVENDWYVRIKAANNVSQVMAHIELTTQSDISLGQQRWKITSN